MANLLQLALGQCQRLLSLSQRVQEAVPLFQHRYHQLLEVRIRVRLRGGAGPMGPAPPGRAFRFTDGRHHLAHHLETKDPGNRHPVRAKGSRRSLADAQKVESFPTLGSRCSARNRQEAGKTQIRGARTREMNPSTRTIIQFRGGDPRRPPPPPHGQTRGILSAELYFLAVENKCASVNFFSSRFPGGGERKARPAPPNHRSRKAQKEHRASKPDKYKIHQASYRNVCSQLLRRADGAPNSRAGFGEALKRTRFVKGPGKVFFPRAANGQRAVNLTYVS